MLSYTVDTAAVPYATHARSNLIYKQKSDHDARIMDEL
jgi:hypothetical protein